MNQEIEAAIQLLESYGYEVNKPERKYTESQIRNAFNGSRVTRDVHYPVNPEWFYYKNVDEYIESITP